MCTAVIEGFVTLPLHTPRLVDTGKMKISMVGKLGALLLNFSAITKPASGNTCCSSPDTHSTSYLFI